MDVLQAEIARKRKQIEKANLVVIAQTRWKLEVTDTLETPANDEPDKKFFRRGDLAAKQQEEYWQKYYEKHADKRPVSEDKRASEEEALSLLEEDCYMRLGRAEVVRRLRERNQPVRLFAESDRDALRRLRRLELDAPELKEGYRNDFKAAMDQVDQEYVEEVIKGSLHEHRKHDVQVDAHIDTIDNIKEMVEDLGDGDAGRDCEVIFAFFNYLLQRWGRDLNERHLNVKRSPKGKFESATHTQTVEHVKPLFSKLKNKTAPSDIREHLVHMTRFLLARDYIQANNAYMEMAVGNAPWPVGVTASGIHQRPGSAKTYVKNIAHVLNDETQRKYIQGLKRLMTKCQNYYPADPSKSVDFVKPKEPEPTAL